MIPRFVADLSARQAMQCVDLVYNELVRIAACCETDELARFATLSEEVLGVVHALLRKTLAPTHTCVMVLAWPPGACVVSHVLVRMVVQYGVQPHPHRIGPHQHQPPGLCWWKVGMLAQLPTRRANLIARASAQSCCGRLAPAVRQRS